MSCLALLPETVTFAPEVEDVAVVQQPAENSRGDDRIPRSSPNSPKPLSEMRMVLPRSYLADTRVKKVADAATADRGRAPQSIGCA